VLSGQSVVNSALFDKIPWAYLAVPSAFWIGAPSFCEWPGLSYFSASIFLPPSRSGAPSVWAKKAGKMASVIRIEKKAVFSGFAKCLQKCLTQCVYLTQKLIFAPIQLIHNSLRAKYRASPPARKTALSYRWSFFQLFAKGSPSAGCKAGFSKAPQKRPQMHF